MINKIWGWMEKFEYLKISYRNTKEKGMKKEQIFPVMATDLIDVIFFIVAFTKEQAKNIAMQKVPALKEFSDETIVGDPVKIVQRNMIAVTPDLEIIKDEKEINLWFDEEKNCWIDCGIPITSVTNYKDLDEEDEKSNDRSWV